MMNLFAKVVKGVLPLTIFAKSSILNFQLCSKYTYGMFSLSRMKIFATWKICSCSQEMQVRYLLLNQDIHYFNMKVC